MADFLTTRPSENPEEHAEYLGELGRQLEEKLASFDEYLRAVYAGKVFDQLEVLGNLILADGKFLFLGTGSDLRISHDGANSFVTNITGGFFIDQNVNSTTGNFRAFNSAGVQKNCINWGGATPRVELYYDDVVKFRTAVNGVEAVGEIKATQSAVVDAQGLTDAATITWNARTQQVAQVVLAGNRTLANPTNMTNGGTYILKVTQDAVGSRTLVYGTAYKWSGGTAPVLTTAVNAVDFLTFVSDGSSMFGVAQVDFK